VDQQVCINSTPTLTRSIQRKKYFPSTSLPSKQLRSIGDTSAPLLGVGLGESLYGGVGEVAWTTQKTKKSKRHGKWTCEQYFIGALVTTMIVKY